MVQINCKRILIIILGGIGNCIMFLPSIKLLSKYITNSKIDVLITANSSKEVFLNIPYVNNVYVLPNKTIDILYSIKELFNKYNLVVSSMGINRVKTFLLSKLIFSENFIFEKGDYKKLISTHEVIRNFHIINRIIKKDYEEPNMKLLYYLNKDNENQADKFYYNHINNKFIAIGHGSGNFLKEKRWATKNWIQLAKLIKEELNYKVVFFGNKSDGELLKPYDNIFNDYIINVSNKFSLNETAALIKKSNLFVSNDCGLMHLAAANNVPVVAIFGPTIIEKNSPFKTKSTIISKNYDCQPCYKFNRKISCSYIKCLNDITVSEVMSGIKKMILTSDSL